MPGEYGKIFHEGSFVDESRIRTAGPALEIPDVDVDVDVDEEDDEEDTGGAVVPLPLPLPCTIEFVEGNVAEVEDRVV